MLDSLEKRLRSYIGSTIRAQTLDVRSGFKPGLPPWRPHVRFRRVQTLVREGSPLVKVRNSA